jgi:hypothetical protein
MSHDKNAPALPFTAAVAGLAMLLGSCGGRAPSAGVAHIGSTTASTGSASGDAASQKTGTDLQKFVSCMRHHGVPSFPELVMTPNGGAVPVGPVEVDKNSPAVQAARSACQYLVPSGQAQGPAAQAISPKDQVDYIKAAACMRAHGVPGFPDPKFSGSSVTFPKPPGMNGGIANSPQLLRAREICEKLIPPGLPYSQQAEQAAGGH